MAEVDRQTIRRLGRTAEWFIIDAIAKKIAPDDRFFLLYEVRGPRAADARVARARAWHAVGRFIDDFLFVAVTREQLELVLGEKEWLAGRLERVGAREANEALCIVISDDPSQPTLVRLAARAVNRPGGSPAIIDR